MSEKCVFVGGLKAAQKSSLSVDHTGDMISVLLRVVQRAETGWGGDTRRHRHLEMRAFFSCMAWSPIPSPLSKFHSTQRWDQASGVPLEILEHLPP